MRIFKCGDLNRLGYSSQSEQWRGPGVEFGGTEKFFATKISE